MMHVSAATGVAAISEARRKQLPIYGETLHQYLLYTAEDYKRPNGQMYHTYPSLKSADDQAALWDGTARGSIHCIATDELCCTLKDKTIGNRIDDITGGNSGVEPRLGVMYTEMVVRRGYSLSRYVDLVSSNAARIMGLSVEFYYFFRAYLFMVLGRSSHAPLPVARRSCAGVSGSTTTRCAAKLLSPPRQSNPHAEEMAE
jgi:dihydroorotase-like cyclic amidohydrolase